MGRSAQSGTRFGGVVESLARPQAGSSPRSFPQLWKKMWKNQGFRLDSPARSRSEAGFRGAKVRIRLFSGRFLPTATEEVTARLNRREAKVH